MQTHVYANHEEIACKAVGNDGVSPQAFPDTCWSPPGPPAGPVAIPYPNTCFAGSITNGTRTVFIGGQEIAIEDHSFFATSTGNEAATEAFGKGVATGVITGKAYFTQWSFDVVFEGFGVPRHTDLVSHNHGSQPGNTAVFPYLSRGFWESFPCKKEEDAIERACGPEADMSETKREIRSRSPLLDLLRRKKNTGVRTGKREEADSWHWTDDHCDGLQLPVGTRPGAVAYIKEMEEIMAALPKEIDAMNLIKAELEGMVADAAAWAAGKWAAKAAVKQAIGSAVPLAGNVAMAAWSVYDVVESVGDVTEIKKVADEALEQLKELEKRLPDMNRLRDEFDKFKQLSPKQQEDAAVKLAAEAQSLLAMLNECVRARKCHLVPFENATGIPPNELKSHEPVKKGGCCFGQTGHHLLPEKSLAGTCLQYKHAAAPTVCAEGTNQNAGSHQQVHVDLAKEHAALVLSALPGTIAADGSMSMSDALDAAARSHQAAFPFSKCSFDCIRAQLAAYYDKVCGANDRPKMVNAQGKLATPPGVVGGDVN